MNQSGTIGALAKALVSAQRHYGKAIKDANNPFFKSKYVDLAGCYDACREALCANDLVVVQTTEVDEAGKFLLRSVLAHSSGEWISGHYLLKPVKDDPQAYGSAVTYARRYALMALVGLAAEDDDGNHASGKTATAPVVTTLPTPDPAPRQRAEDARQIKRDVPSSNWTPDQTSEVTRLGQAVREHGSAAIKELEALKRACTGMAPSDTIDAVSVLLRKWEDIAAQGAKP